VNLNISPTSFIIYTNSLGEDIKGKRKKLTLFVIFLSVPSIIVAEFILTYVLNQFGTPEWIFYLLQFGFLLLGFFIVIQILKKLMGKWIESGRITYHSDRIEITGDNKYSIPYEDLILIQPGFVDARQIYALEFKKCRIRFQTCTGKDFYITADHLSKEPFRKIEMYAFLKQLSNENHHMHKVLFEFKKLMPDKLA
jgi:hypothetical protein